MWETCRRSQHSQRLRGHTMFANMKYHYRNKKLRQTVFASLYKVQVEFFLFKKNCQQSLKGRCHKMLTPSSWFSPISAHSWSILHKVAMTWRYSQVMTQQSLYLTLQSPKCFLQFFQMFCSNLKRQFRNNVDTLFHDLTSFRPKNQGLKHLTDQGFEIWRYFSKFV